MPWGQVILAREETQDEMVRQIITNIKILASSSRWVLSYYLLSNLKTNIKYFSNSDCHSRYLPKLDSKACLKCPIHYFEVTKTPPNCAGKYLTGESSASFESWKKTVWRPKGRQLNKFGSLLFTIMITMLHITKLSFLWSPKLFSSYLILPWIVPIGMNLENFGHTWKTLL